MFDQVSQGILTSVVACSVHIKDNGFVSFCFKCMDLAPIFS